jgi:hypothetical protein
MKDIYVTFRDEDNNLDIYFWKSPINYTMVINIEERVAVILDFRYEKNIWTFENTSILHEDYGKRCECYMISDGRSLPPVDGWDENTPPKIIEYLKTAYSLLNENGK